MRPWVCWLPRRVAASSPPFRRSLATATATSRRPQPRPSFPTVPTCPQTPACACAAMPDGLDIDRKSPLNGVMMGYAEQILVCTGAPGTWPSKIEDERDGNNLAANLKQLFGRGGVYSDPFHNVSVLNASFPSSPPPHAQSPERAQSASAYLLPSFKYVPLLPRRGSLDALRAMAKAYVLPEKLHPMHDGLSPDQRAVLTRDASLAAQLRGVTDVRDVMVLICGHGQRDDRCGILGPVLQFEFEQRLADVGGLEVRKDAAELGRETSTTGARVGLISHIGGHKFAGNVIIYVPPDLAMDDGRAHPLAGYGIWYGRVEPKHVAGIVSETIVKGNVVEDMFRGGIDQQRRILRL